MFDEPQIIAIVDEIREFLRTVANQAAAVSDRVNDLDDRVETLETLAAQLTCQIEATRFPLARRLDALEEAARRATPVD